MVQRSTASVRRAVVIVVSALLVLLVGVVESPPGHAAVGTNRINVGEKIAANQQIISPSGLVRLAVGSDGNMVLYGGPKNQVLWQTATTQNPGGSALLGTDGNLAVYNAAGAPVWQAGIANRGVSFLQVQDDGNLVAYTAAGASVWQTGTRYWPSSLAPGQRLEKGQKLRSPDGRTELRMQEDGNLALYAANGVARWSTVTAGSEGSYATFQTDGNFVLYSAAGQALWSSLTQNQGATTLSLQDDGNLVIYTGSSSLWQTQTMFFPDRVSAGAGLAAGARIQSPNGSFEARMQSDGNFVLYGPTGSMWQSGTRGSGNRLSVQSDGNLVMYSSTGGVVWQTQTNGRGPAELRVQDDGNLVLYQVGGSWTWQTYTYPGYQPPAPQEPQLSNGQKAVNWALQQLGKPYQWGGTGPNAFDCSGLTQQSWQSVGVQIPRVSRDQYRSLPKVSLSALQPGDILAWGDNPNDAESVYHVALYVGNGQFVEAPAPGMVVRTRALSSKMSDLMPYAVRPGA
ncbi:NlpC/P60 family protein [Cellulomonas denverensis]|uniref:Bulb-type lectin domain-containing protein n=1 Tax=Cellulomonas denverensis TaxID=264297 RepID=A0A7X6KVU9_9CELL|nr:NlpC/P60 family protein [Cellulomonas denverensis]NKY23219.1 hypothetical protein [Cellulomonas denverensis]